MAFTIDFGGDESEETEKKKLSLRDGIRRFAPSKKTREKTPIVTAVTSHVTTVTASSQAVRMATNTNEFVDRKQLSTPEMLKATSGATRVVVDRENNIQSDDVARDAREKRVGDAASEAGTYTIDQVKCCDCFLAR